MGPNMRVPTGTADHSAFQSSVRINVGPNRILLMDSNGHFLFQSSVRINVGPNFRSWLGHQASSHVSILRED